MEKKLQRSSTDKVIAGVCGGLGKYFDIDPVIFRVAFVALFLLAGNGILVYLILWLIMPEEPASAVDFAPEPEEPEQPLG